MKKTLWGFVLIFTLLLGWDANFALANEATQTLSKKTVLKLEQPEIKPTITDPIKGKERLDKIMAQADKIWEKTRDEKVVNQFLEQNGIIQIEQEVDEEEEQLIGITSIREDVTINKPSVARDTATGWYIFTGTMQWKSGKSKNDCCNAGDADAMSIMLSDDKGVQNVGYSVTTFWNSNLFPSQTYQNAEEYVDGGVIFKVQDSFKSGVYSIDSYRMHLYLNVVGSRSWGSVSVHHDYVHTWGGTAINSLGFSTTGLTVGWKNNNYGWKVTSSPSYW